VVFDTIVVLVPVEVLEEVLVVLFAVPVEV
jgi:hypothetical protein